MKLVLKILLVMIPVYTRAQEYQYSQFYNAPLLLNPALTGDHESDYRFFMNYKNQWSSISNAFKTITGSFDMPVFGDVSGMNKFGIGMSFLSDKAGKTNYGYNYINLSLAYHTKINRYSKLAGGLVFGYGQNQADLNGVKWESQHNGNNYDPSLPSGESVFADRIIYFDAGVGVTWTLTDPENDINYRIGLSSVHTNYPNHSFIGEFRDRLKPNIKLHGEMDIGFEAFTLKPKLLIQNQGPSTSFGIGSLARFNLGSQPDSKYTDAYVSSAFEIGLLYRYAESLIFTAQYEFKKNLLIGMSYDMIISKLSAVSRAGGYEIAIRYQGMFSNQRIKVKNLMDDDKNEVPGKKTKKNKSNIRM